MEPLEFVRERFARYYETVDVEPPACMEQREFALMPLGKGGMWRHIGFRGVDEMRGAFARNVPGAVYYSTAYYKEPGARTMAEKGWLGADLIFDLDADHIEGAEGLSYAEMMARVKDEFIKLLEGYILSDFGFDEKCVRVAFSGGRGYHAHVTDPRVRKLGSHERREIVDYIGATGLDLAIIFPKEAFGMKGRGRFARTTYKRTWPRDCGGWSRKLRDEVSALLNEMEAMDRESAIKFLKAAEGIGDKGAERIYDDLFKGQAGARGMDKILNEGSIEAFSEERHLTSFLGLVEDRARVRLTGEADEPVTSDVKRLIRLPGSLHAKTGLTAMLLKIDALKGFDPLRDAVPPTLSGEGVKLVGLADDDVKVKGFHVKVGKGRAVEAPEYAALFLVCRRLCAPSS
ncbi:MAG: DNA primase small subunit PriS [Euryarchaeota archaeon]|nr:DNA primase small subunit PriS [Euryarchaeota archaeon]